MAPVSYSAREAAREALREAREVLTSRCVTLVPGIWARVEAWAVDASRQLVLPAGLVCRRYLNLLDDDIQESLKGR